jgi:ComF family protein
VNAWSWPSKVGRVLLDLLYPVFCVGCRQPGKLYCPACRKAVRRISPPLCPLCGQPQRQAQLCPQCTYSFSDEDRRPPIDGIRSVAYLEGTLREAIYGLKYNYIQELAAPLGEMLIEYYNSVPLPADIIIPVPLHRRRRRERGYNQSALLAQRLGQATQIPVRRDMLHRHRYTRSQTRLNAQERSRNVQGAFSCDGHRSAAQATVGKRLLLIDDVATTGATLRACAQVLRDQGARSVWALTVARASPDRRT